VGEAIGEVSASASGDDLAFRSADVGALPISRYSFEWTELAEPGSFPGRRST